MVRVEKNPAPVALGGESDTVMLAAKHARQPRKGAAAPEYSGTTKLDDVRETVIGYGDGQRLRNS